MTLVSFHFMLQLSATIYLSIVLPILCCVYIVVTRGIRSKRQKYSCPFCLPFCPLVPEAVGSPIWTCSSCQGRFRHSRDENGDVEWIPVIPEPYGMNENSQSSFWNMPGGARSPQKGPTNGLCRLCNHHQSIIVHFLSQLEDPDTIPQPRLASILDSLEQRYPLCTSCRYIVEKRLGSQDKKLQSRGMVKAQQQGNPPSKISLRSILSIIYFVPHLTLSPLFDISSIPFISDLGHTLFLLEILWISCAFIGLGGAKRVISSWKAIVWCLLVRPKVATFLSFDLMTEYIWLGLDLVVFILAIYGNTDININSTKNSSDRHLFSPALIQKKYPVKLSPSILPGPSAGLETSFASFGIGDQKRRVVKHTSQSTNVMLFSALAIGVTASVVSSLFLSS